MSVLKLASYYPTIVQTMQRSTLPMDVDCVGVDVGTINVKEHLYGLGQALGFRQCLTLFKFSIILLLWIHHLSTSNSSQHKWIAKGA